MYILSVLELGFRRAWFPEIYVCMCHTNILQEANGTKFKNVPCDQLHATRQACFHCHLVVKRMHVILVRLPMLQHCCLMHAYQG